MKTSAQQQFSKNPEQYRDEPLFSSGKDLDAMVSCRSLNGDETLLDIGTGAGHTAIAFSPFVKHCTGIDITEKIGSNRRSICRTEKRLKMWFFNKAMQHNWILQTNLLILSHAGMRPIISRRSSFPCRK
ncbi:class I SAM-dependent methyltransferase [Bacillus haynesii]|uniref:class I SAM-dependent methyltransferase n=1 Tax=Bacillus haynesii TaxID=1925021 RepID=UPI0004BAB197|nr:class I SAM-dependent methyltransferase [Bacillus haynesii]